MGMDGLVALCAALGIDPESDVRLLRGARVESYPLTAFQTTTPACRRRKNHLKRTSSPCRVRSRPQVPLLAPQGQEARAVIEGGVVRGPRAPAPRLDREAKGLCARARPREPRQAVVPRFFQVRVPLLARRGVWIEALSRRSFFRARRGSRTFAAGVGLQRGSRHRRGCHADLPCRQVAATPRLPRGSFREDESRRRCGCDVDIPRRRVAATPRRRRGHSVETSRTPQVRRRPERPLRQTTGARRDARADGGLFVPLRPRRELLGGAV